MSMLKPTIVLLSANTGYGHTKAAVSLQRDLELRLPGWDVIHEDASAHSNLPNSIKAERLWSLFSTVAFIRPIYSALHQRFISRARLAYIVRFAFHGVGDRLYQRFAESNVRVVIALHPGAAAAATLWKRKQDFFLASVATDLVVHEFHSFKEIDQIFCDKRASVLIEKKNIASFSDRAYFSGLPIEEKFFESNNKDRSDKFYNILFTFGAKGLRSSAHLRRFTKAIKETSSLRAVIVCGYNVRMLHHARQLTHEYDIQNRCKVVGFVENMDELLQSADIFVGKPGGITTGELLASGKRAVILDLLPGQEEYNLKVLQRFGIALFAPRGPLSEVLLNAVQLDNPLRIEFFDNFAKQGVGVIANAVCQSITYESLEEPSERTQANLRTCF